MIVAQHCHMQLLRLNIFFFFQAEDGIRDTSVTGVQTCALPISALRTISASVSPNTWRRSEWPRSTQSQSSRIIDTETSPVNAPAATAAQFCAPTDRKSVV